MSDLHSKTHHRSSTSRVDYCTVVPARPVDMEFTYEVPSHLSGRVRQGVRVVVPLGKSNTVGYVTSTSTEPPKDIEKIRPITKVIDQRPIFDEILLKTLKWAAAYYLHPLGEVLKSAHPGGKRGRKRFRLTAKARKLLDEKGADALLGSQKQDRGGFLLELLRERPLTKAGLEARAGSSFSESTFNKLKKQGLVTAAGRPGQAGLEACVRKVYPLHEATSSRLGPKQQAVIASVMSRPGTSVRELASVLGSNESNAYKVVKSLEKRRLVKVEEEVLKPKPYRSTFHDSSPKNIELTNHQRAAVDAILTASRKSRFKSFLLWGVTGSGKTEVYLQVARRVLERGKSVLVLVPEIALTPQLSARFRSRFGDKVAILHSGLTGSVRKDEWNRCRYGFARIALGPRSAAFAPLEDLGLVVVDEEHDSSLKSDDGFKYSARDLALVRAMHAGAVAVLGSATPSLESIHNSRTGKYGLLTLPERVMSRPSPEIRVVRIAGFSDDEVIGRDLAAEIRETLDRGEQCMLFLNRRGYAPVMLCRACGHAVKCPNCAVSLTAHKGSARLVCHYCGFERRPPSACEVCGSESIGLLGTGTERLESEVRRRFPRARVVRLDRDTASGKGELERILDRFGRGEKDILVGTQMLAKGHDFPGVTLVGVVLADIGLNLPDFRSAERTYQLLTQVAGRAGRGNMPGRVIIQALRTDAAAIEAVKSGNAEEFYDRELQDRQRAMYPPFSRLALVRLESEDKDMVRKAAQVLASRFRHSPVKGARVLGPAPSPFTMLRGRYRWQMLVKAVDDKCRRTALDILMDSGKEVVGSKVVKVTIDIDPTNML